MSASGSAGGPGTVRAMSARDVPALWFVVAGVVISTALAVFVNVPVGLVALAVVVAAAGMWRAVAPSPGPVGITVRSKVFDVVLYAAFAAAIVFLALTTPLI